MKDKSKLILAIFSMAFILMAAMNIAPALSSIAKAYPDVPREMIQLLITIPSFFIILASLCSDLIARRIYLKNTVLLGSVIFTFAGTLPMFVEGFGIMIASRVIVGIGLGIIQPLVMTIIFKHFTDVNERNTIIGWGGCASAIGNITTTFLAGLLAVYGYKIAFSVHLLGLTTFFCVLFLLPKREREQSVNSLADKKMTDMKKVKKKGKLTATTIRWLFVPFIYLAFLHCFATNLSMLVEESDIGSSAVSGMGLSMLTVGSFICGLFYGKLVRLTKKYTLPIAMLLSSLGLLIMVVAFSPIVVYASGICTGFGMGMVMPVIITNVVCSAASENTTFVIALNGAMANLGLSVAPFTVSGISYIFVGNSIRGRYYVCAGIIMIMAVTAFVLALRGKL